MSLETPKLLIVEEEEVLAEITAFRLELLGYAVEVVKSGERAWAKAQNESIDLVILDTILSDMDGMELINRLQSDSHTSSIPLLVVSADADLEMVQRAYVAGASAILVTPYDPAVLEEKVEALLQQRAIVNR